MTVVAIIIPYYQKKPGILRQALESIIRQRIPPGTELDIIIVDDSSPVPARTETETLALPPSCRLKIVEQPNGGVASARNMGLRNVPAGATYIAFLDSDDIWDAGHLGESLSLLETGMDFYFCDHRRLEKHDAYFPQTRFDKFLSGDDARPVGEGLYEIKKQPFFNFFLRTFVPQISTVVYRRVIAPEISFDETLRAAGEDYLFLLQLVVKSARVGCSSHLRVTCGKGINIYSSKYSWGDPGHLIRYMGELLALYRFQQRLPLAKDDKSYLSNMVKCIRTDFAFLTTRYFIKNRELWPKELVDLTRYDRWFWLWYPVYVLYVAICYPLGLYKSPT